MAVGTSYDYLFYVLNRAPVPIYDACKDPGFVFDSKHLDNIPNCYLVYKNGASDLYPGLFASVVYQYGLYQKSGEMLTSETSPRLQLHPVLVLVHKHY